MGFEDNFLGNLDRRRQSKDFLHPNIEKAHRRTEDIFKREAIKLEDFLGVQPYSDEQIAADILKAKELEAKFKIRDPHKVYADVMEGLIYRQIGQSQWFGEEAEAVKTSLFDDYINGIDLMVKFEDKSRAKRYLGLAVDVTFSADANTGTLDKKFDRIKKEIDEGHLGEVRYFKSNNTRMVFNDLPRVVVGMERTKVMELATLWLDEDRHGELKKHPIQRMILEQTLAQLAGFARHAESQGHPHLAQILRDEIPLIKGIIASKQEEGIVLGDMRFDEVHRQIMSKANGF